MGRDMGIGLLGDPNLIIKKKHQYTLQFDVCTGETVEEHFVKIAGKPNISIESIELNFLNEKMFIPGKATWETISVTYIDVAGSALMPLWDWLASVYDFTSTKRTMGSSPSVYGATGRLVEYSGCGDPLASWTLQNCWPENINFGELDNSSSEESQIELTIRYSGVTYFNHCGRQPKACPCLPCDTPLRSRGGGNTLPATGGPNGGAGNGFTQTA